MVSGYYQVIFYNLRYLSREKSKKEPNRETDIANPSDRLIQKRLLQLRSETRRGAYFRRNITTSGHNGSKHYQNIKTFRFFSTFQVCTHSKRNNPRSCNITAEISSSTCF